MGVLASGRGAHAAYDARLEEVAGALAQLGKDATAAQARSREVVSVLAQLLAARSLMDCAPAEVTEAYVSTRLDAASTHAGWVLSGVADQRAASMLVDRARLE